MKKLFISILAIAFSITASGQNGILNNFKLSSNLLPNSNTIETSKIVLVNNVTTPWSYAFYLQVKNPETKAFTVLDSEKNEIFKIMGTGAVNAKAIFAEVFQVRPDAFNTVWWYDHVFNNDYKLIPLYEVEKFIKNNRHLPDIPSEKEVKKSGFDLVEMNALLLKKVEELTLYTIQQQKEIDELKKIIKSNNKTK